MDWQVLTKLTDGAEIVVERVRLVSSGVRIEGEFELPALARLNAEDQVFVAAFVRSHGSIKEMERLFGVSYPTIKNRLNRLGEQLELELVQVDAAPSRAEVLEKLEKGEISVQEAVELLRRR
jgi:hypothetical protein